MHEKQIVATTVAHPPTHARVALAEAQVVGGVVARRFALGPVPVAAVLEVHDVDAVAADDGAARLQAQVVHATDALLKNLRPHKRQQSALQALLNSVREGRLH